MMIEAIVEVWCSPLRREDYSVKIIPLFAGEMFNVEDDIRDYIKWDFYLNTFGVDYAEVKGLWKVVFKISVSYSTYYTYAGPDDDVDIGQEVLFKGQCQEWAEMKYTWLELNGKIDEYFSKPWKRHVIGL
jgi:hypothetical protein